MRRSLIATCALSLVFFLSACEFFALPPPLSEAQVEELQSFQIEAPLAKVQKSAIIVLQGLGYSVESKDKDTGFITAKGLVSQRQAPEDCNYVWDPYQLKNIRHCRRGERYSVFRRLTLSFEQIGNYTHLRLIIVVVDSRHGDKIIAKNEPYQAIFSRIEDRLFVRDAINPT